MLMRVDARDRGVRGAIDLEKLVDFRAVRRLDRPTQYRVLRDAARAVREFVDAWDHGDVRELPPWVVYIHRSPVDVPLVAA